MRIFCIVSFLSFLDTLFLYLRSCDHLLTYIVLILLSICGCMFFLSPIPYMCYFFSLFMHMLLITCMQSTIFVSHKDALMCFV